MPKFLVTAQLLIKSTEELNLTDHKVIQKTKSEYVYENYEILADDEKEAKQFGYSEWYQKHGIKGRDLIIPDRMWIDCEVIQLHSGKGAGKGGYRAGAGRKKGSGSKYSEETKAMKIPVRFDRKMGDIIQMCDDLKTFLNNWEEGLQPQPEGHYSARKELARKMFDDLKSMCGVLEEIPPGNE